MPVDRVLIEGDQQIDSITEACDFINAGADRQKGMAPSDDRLVRVVSVNVQAAARKNLCEDVSGRRHALPRGSPYCYCESAVHMWGLCQNGWREPVLLCTTKGQYNVLQMTERLWQVVKESRRTDGVPREKYDSCAKSAILEGCRGGSLGQGHNIQVTGFDIFAREDHR